MAILMAANNTQTQAGEDFVISQLKSNGYYSVVKTEDSYIEADGSMRRILLSIKPHSGNNPDFTESEIKRLTKAAAESSNREPWGALVGSDQNGSYTIHWYNFSK